MVRKRKDRDMSGSMPESSETLFMDILPTESCIFLKKASQGGGNRSKILFKKCSVVPGETEERPNMFCGGGSGEVLHCTGLKV